jgi:predicted transcriptional regulator
MPRIWVPHISIPVSVAFVILIVGILANVVTIPLMLLHPDLIPSWLWAVAFYFVEIPAFLYFLASDKGYPPEVVEAVTVEGLSPQEVEHLQGSKRHRFLWFILRVIDDIPNKSGADITRFANRSGFQYTPQNTDDALDQLTLLGLIQTPPNPQRRQYTLTARGRVCLKLIDLYFPRTWFSYLAQVLGHRRPLGSP